MRLHVLSDLHLEFGPVVVPDVEADAVVLAGDISVGVRGVEWAGRRFAGRPVLYVPGNHEYYGHAYPGLLEKLLRRGSALGVNVLSDTVHVIGAVRFIGATLWTDFGLLSEEARALATALDQMADYRKIRVQPSYRRVRPVDTMQWHWRSRRWLETALGVPHAGPTVVITHHAPSARSLDPRHASDPLCAAYASALDDLVGRSGAACWVHGHTHAHVDYLLGATRVLSNQRGYPDEPTAGFDPGLVITVDEGGYSTTAPAS